MSYASEVLADSPDVYFRMSETGSGPFVDVIAAHNATPNGTITSNASLIPADPDNVAARFDPAGTFFKATTSYVLNVTQPITAEFWIKPVSIVAADMYVMVATQTGANGWSVSMIASTGAWRWVSHGVGTMNFSATGAAGVVQHVVMSMVPTGEVSLYINGVFQQVSGVIGIAAGTETFDLGHSTLAPNAVIDEIAVYKSVLSAARIAAHYQEANKLNVAGWTTRSGGY